ncbi:MAG: hypothetical protein KDJ47_11920 [Hyphomicrobiaceae bacterium]|nr:hypothetical protein [Hyphomicrobiaceae bacterium]
MRKKVGGPVLIAATLGMFGILTGAGSAVADVIVIGASGASVKPGQVLTSDATLSLPGGARVRVMLASGRTQELKGPGQIKIGDLGKGEAVNESLWNDVKRLVATQTSARESELGAVRSVAPTKSSRSFSASRGGEALGELGAAGTAFSWRRVSVDREGDVCVEKSAPIELVRNSPGRPLAVTIVNIQAKKRGMAEFSAGSATTSWPASVGSDVGLYAVVLPDGGRHEVRLRPIKPLPAADDTLRVLHGQRCLAQVEAWLRGQMTASR